MIKAGTKALGTVEMVDGMDDATVRRWKAGMPDRRYGRGAARIVLSSPMPLAPGPHVPPRHVRARALGAPRSGQAHESTYDAAHPSVGPLRLSNENPARRIVRAWLVATCSLLRRIDRWLAAQFGKILIFAATKFS
ncbi:hypothetical protein ABZP36_032150 [Zizania latifolia]